MNQYFCEAVCDKIKVKDKLIIYENNCPNWTCWYIATNTSCGDGVYSINYQYTSCLEGGGSTVWTEHITVSGNSIVDDNTSSLVGNAPIDAAGKSQARFNTTNGLSDDFFTFSRNENGEAAVSATFALYAQQTEEGSVTCYGSGSGRRISP